MNQGNRAAPTADRLLQAAREEATRLKHDYVGTEHLFLGLLAVRDPIVLGTMARLGLDPEVVRERIERRAPKGKALEVSGELVLRSGARRAVEAAQRAARAQGVAEFAGHHLVTTLLVDSRGVVAAALAEAGASIERWRETLREAEDSPRARPRTGRAAGRQDRGAPPRPEPARQPAQEPPTPRGRNSWWSIRNLSLLAVPLSLVLTYLVQVSPLVVFLAACAAVLPLAAIMGEATEHLSFKSGPAVGGLLNATFGNAAELIIAIVALRAGLIQLVKASITGSILGNLLLILGLSLVAGGANRPMLRFNRTSAGMSAGMLSLALVGLVFPAIFHHLHPEASARASELYLSESVAAILIVTYGFSLLFSLKTHNRIFCGEPHPAGGSAWGVGRSVLVLALATAGVAVESEILVHATEDLTAQSRIFSQTFLGLIVIPIIGNAAEHATAVVVARKGQIDLALQVALGSSTQVALLVAPLLVFVGLILGQPMDLVFTTLEVAAVALATVVTSIIMLDGESHWFEGVQLLAVYGIIAAAVFFI